MASAAAPGPGETAASRRAPGDSPPGAQPPVNGCRGRRRRRPRRPHRGPGNGEGAPPEPLVQDDGAPPVRGLPCVVDWSDRMERTAADMRRAIIVTAFGDRPPLRADEVKATLAGRFGLDQATIDAKPAGNDTFFVFLGDDATVARAPRRTPVRPQPGPVASNTPQVAAVVEADGSGTVGLGPPATVTPIDESVSKGKQAAFLVETDDDDRGVGEPLAPCRPAALASNGQHAATDAEEGGNGLATTCCGVVLSDAQREAAVVEMAGPGTAETPRWTETSGDGAPPPSGVDPLVPDAIDATPIPNDGCASPSLVMPASPVIGPQTSVRRIGSGTEAPALELSPSPIMGFTPTASGGGP
nr:unnamed protein product [Digitaria exilis]